MSVKLYRKRPVVIEAVQFSGSSTQRNCIEDWIDGHNYVAPTLVTADMGTFEIETLEGNMTVRPSDYVIRGVAGEFYPCRADIFEATYEPVVNQ